MNIVFTKLNQLIFTNFHNMLKIPDFLKDNRKKASVTSLGRPIRPALISSFRSMKQLGVFLLPPGWDASPSQGYPQHFRRCPFIHLGGERRSESKVSCRRTQHNVPSQDPNLDHSIRSRAL